MRFTKKTKGKKTYRKKTFKKRTYRRPTKELKYVAQAGAAQDIVVGGTAVQLTYPTQGTSDMHRDGKKIFLKYLRLRARFLPFTSSSTARVMIVWDKNPKGTAPGISEIYQTAGASTGILALRNRATGNRFKILKDYVLSMDASTLNSREKIIDWYIKINKTVLFDQGSTGGIADIEHGALYIMTQSEDAGGSCIRWTWESQLNFIDI